MANQELKIGPWLQEGLNLYKENFLLLIVVNFLALVLGKITLGILMGPMLAGVVLVNLMLLDKKEPKTEIGDVFKGFDFFLDSFLLVLACAVVSIAAALLSKLVFTLPIAILVFLVISILLHTVAVFALFLIADKKMDFWPAVMAVIGAMRAALLPLVAMAVVTGILSMVGALACGIGVVVTFPLYFSVLAVVYRDLLRNPAAA